MTAITKNFIEINLSTDELMLKELERRDGIYSFIFHELEVPRADTPTPSIAPAKIMDSNYLAKTTTTTNTEELALNADNESCILPDELKIKTESTQSQCSTIVGNSSNTTTTIATTQTLVFFTPITTSLNSISTLPTITSSRLATTSTTAASTILVPSLFANTPLTTPSSSTTTTTDMSTSINGNIGTLPYMPSLSGVSMRSYHEYLKTWHPSPSLVYDNPKLFAYMTNCGFRVRLATPRFSHISAPLVRNRRHALKETIEYKRITDFCMCAPVADLRALFPHDPDVHAPFATTTTVDIVAAPTATTLPLIDGEIAVEFDDGCCGDVAGSLTGSPILQ